MENRLKEFGESKKLLQKDMARLLGIAVSTYSLWETGTFEINNKSLKKLADFFNVSIDYLLGRDVATPQSTVLPPILTQTPIALYGGVDPKDLTQDDLDNLANIARAFAERNKNKKQ
jgi:transcriptional regulator with XRE-family HTH domain